MTTPRTDPPEAETANTELRAEVERLRASLAEAHQDAHSMEDALDGD